LVTFVAQSNIKLKNPLLVLTSVLEMQTPIKSQLSILISIYTDNSNNINPNIKCFKRILDISFDME
jgi:hypothetical protein